MRQPYLIAYDIGDSRRRVRARQAIKGHAVGGQDSVYECWLDESERQALGATLAALVDGERDRVVVIGLDPRAAIRTLGVATVMPGNDCLFYQG